MHASSFCTGAHDPMRFQNLQCLICKLINQQYKLELCNTSLKLGNWKLRASSSPLHSS